jgi:hypothetical protein
MSTLFPRACTSASAPCRCITRKIAATMSSGGGGGCNAVARGEGDVTVGADDVPPVVSTEECPMSVSPAVVRARCPPTEAGTTREGLVSKEEAEAEAEAEAENARKASPRVS